MNIPNLSGLMTLGKSFVTANRPEIMFGASVISTLSGVILAAKGGWDARGKVDEANAERTLSGEEPLTKKEIAQLTWINYLPAAGATAGALGATTGLHLVHVKEKKQLAAAALMAVDQVKKDAEEFKKEVLESVGLAKSEDPKELQRVANKSGIAKIVNSDGETEELYLVRDEKTQRDFWTNRQRIDSAMIELNRRLTHDDVELNYFYTQANMGHIPEGESVGWNAGTMVGLEWDTTVRDDQRPVRTFSFSPEPFNGHGGAYT